MFIFLSKFLPLLIYPLSLAVILLVLALVLRKKTRWLIGLLLAAVLLLWVGGNRWVSMSLARSLEWRNLPAQTLPQVDAIVVLGGATEAAQYPRPGVEVNGAADRVLYAARLYHQGLAPVILVSGGYIDWQEDPSGSPAAEMQSLLMELGVPQEAIWLEERSLNTHENAVYSQQMLNEKGLKRILLVTSAMHMPRALALFQEQNLEVIPAPTDFTITQENWDALWSPNWQSLLINLLPSTSSLSLTTNVLKEYLGMLVYHLQGWM